MSFYVASRSGLLLYSDDGEKRGAKDMMSWSYIKLLLCMSIILYNCICYIYYVTVGKW